MTAPKSSKKAKAASKSTGLALSPAQGGHGFIQEAYDVYCKENGGSAPSIYRLALISGQSKYLCRHFLEQTDLNPQQANDDRREASLLRLQKAYTIYVQKHKGQPSIRALACLANASLRSAQSYLKMLQANLPKVKTEQSLYSDDRYMSEMKGALPANSPKRTDSPVGSAFLPSGKVLTKARISKLEEGYQRFIKKKGIKELSWADIGRVADLSGVDFWITVNYCRKNGLFKE